MKAEYLIERLSTIAQIMKTWAEEAQRDSETWKGKIDSLSEYYNGKKQAYSMASEWINEIISKNIED